MPHSIPVILPKNKFLRFFLRPLYSLSNFVKSSILSLLIVGVILGLTNEMDQAKTMLVAMIEPDSADLIGQRLSLFLCFVFLVILSIGLSHFPIYIYYAGNLNGSKKHVYLEKRVPFIKNPAFSWIRVFVYVLKENVGGKKYIKDWLANVFRNFLGLAVFTVWTRFIYWTFEPNLKFYDTSISNTFSDRFSLVLCILPYLVYFAFRYLLQPEVRNVDFRKRLYKLIGRCHFFFFILSVSFLAFTLFFANFSQLFFFILTLTSFFMSMNYVFFRLARPRIYHVLRNLFKEGKTKQSMVYAFNNLIKRFISPERYLGFFVISFVGSLLLVSYFTLASFIDLPLPNSLTIVFVFLYFYFYLFSVIYKYYFVKYSIAKKQMEDSSTQAPLSSFSFKLITGALIFIATLQIVGLFFSVEKQENSLELLPYKKDNYLSLSDFLETKDSILTKNNVDTIYFVTAQGGGLKSNYWTLNVLDELNKQTHNSFIKNTIVFSGASGGTMGLALYSDIYGTYGASKSDIIYNIGKNDYVSRDIAMLFGVDLARSTFPWNMFRIPRDRSYYNTLEYINIIHKDDKDLTAIPETSFQTYWKNLYNKCGKQLPILLINTACTDGKRGIFCSVAEKEFDKIFNFSHDLNTIFDHNGEQKTVSFYEAVSTTNRFPFVAPMAKIEGVGHFIDAGAIDNSGILSAWDMYHYLNQKEKSKLLKNRVVMFVEINNGKADYIQKLMNKFVSEHTEYINEDETSSIVANLTTGLNLDKIPGYLKAFLNEQEELDSNFLHREICFPQKVSIEDIESSYYKGKIMNKDLRSDLEIFLEQENSRILDQTERETPLTQQWKYYEPALSRHMSNCNLKYYESQRSSILEQFKGN